jgi:aerobic carbon-monoxide dehydrogenase large subunit
MSGRQDRRREDPPLLRGERLFAGDHRVDGQAYLALVRSPHPRARVTGVDLAAALALPGVIAAWTGDDLGLGGRGLPVPPIPGVDLRPRPILAGDAVRYIGEPVVAIVAESRQAAADAVEMVWIDFEPEPGYGGVEAALAGGASPIHPGMSSNRAGTLHRGFGDPEAAFAGAVAVGATLRLARVSGGYLEPRAVTALPEAGGSLTLHSSTQWVFGVREAVAQALDLDPGRITVKAGAVGGGFGAKGMAYPEEVLAAMAARRLGRPVQWVGSRSEDTAATAQHHGTVVELELAAELDGTLRGLRGRILHQLGAYATSAAGQIDNICSHIISAYRLPAFDVACDLVYTDTAPSGFIRGGGREVGVYAIERLLDRLALRLGLDPVELRRRNLIQPDQMPYDTGYRSPRGGVVYDGGDYPAMLERAVAMLGPAEGHPEPAPSECEGWAVACFVESTGIGAPEHARARIESDGTITVRVGTTPQGQGHETVAARVAAERLGWPEECIRVVAGDSTAVPFGAVTAGSRSGVEMGNAVSRVAQAARQRLVELGAEHLEAAPADVVVEPTGASVRGAPTRTVPLAELVGDGIEVAEVYDASGGNAYAGGCAAARVRVDLETGLVAIDRYVMVHDAGRQLHAPIVQGQAHGGLAHGIGYALLEEAAYTDTGEFLSASFLDYMLPTIGEVVPDPRMEHLDSPASSNPEGVRGVGEGGTIPAAPVLAGAIENALKSRGIDVFLDTLPVTPERILAALEAGWVRAGG